MIICNFKWLSSTIPPNQKPSPILVTLPVNPCVCPWTQLLVPRRRRPLFRKGFPKFLEKWGASESPRCFISSLGREKVCASESVKWICAEDFLRIELHVWSKETLLTNYLIKLKVCLLLLCKREICRPPASSYLFCK